MKKINLIKCKQIPLFRVMCIGKKDKVYVMRNSSSLNSSLFIFIKANCIKKLTMEIFKNILFSKFNFSCI